MDAEPELLPVHVPRGESVGSEEGEALEDGQDRLESLARAEKLLTEVEAV